MPEVSAWHYWLLITGTTPSDNEGLEGTGDVPAKRMYVLGQFSRFVRPDYYRIGVNNPTSAFISAYQDTNSGNFAIVAINTNATSLDQTFNLTNFTTTSVTPWITSSTLSLAGQSALPVAGSTFTYTLPAMSVVTFVGQATANTSPTLTPVADQTINAGQTLVITNVAGDTDLPLQTLTFSPANVFPLTATVDGSSGIFTWRAPVSVANTTNLISIAVTDDGTPPMSATNNFNVIVNPLVRPAISSLNAAGGQVSLTVNGAAGPDYILQTSTNLLDWQTIVTTNSPALPLTLTDTNFNDAMRFYRIQIGP